MSEPETVSFDGAVAVREGAKTLLVRVEGREVWLPKSQIHEDSEVFRPGDTGKLVIPEWLATDRGLA